MLTSTRSVITFVVISSLVGFVLGALGIDGMTRITCSIAFASAGTVIANGLANNRKAVRVSSADKRDLLSRRPPADRATLFLYRRGYNGMAAGVDVTIDGVTVAQLKSPACTRLDLSPGQHRIGARMAAGTGGKPGMAELTMRAGDTVAVQIKMGFGKVTLERQPDIDTVRQLLSRMTMVMPEQSAPLDAE